MPDDKNIFPGSEPWEQTGTTTQPSFIGRWFGKTPVGRFLNRLLPPITSSAPEDIPDSGNTPPSSQPVENENGVEVTELDSPDVVARRISRRKAMKEIGKKLFTLGVVAPVALETLFSLPTDTPPNLNKRNVVFLLSSGNIPDDSEPILAGAIKVAGDNPLIIRCPQFPDISDPAKRGEAASAFLKEQLQMAEGEARQQVKKLDIENLVVAGEGAVWGYLYSSPTSYPLIRLDEIPALWPLNPDHVRPTQRLILWSRNEFDNLSTSQLGIITMNARGGQQALIVTGDLSGDITLIDSVTQAQMPASVIQPEAYKADIIISLPSHNPAILETAQKASPHANTVSLSPYSFQYDPAVDTPYTLGSRIFDAISSHFSAYNQTTQLGSLFICGETDKTGRFVISCQRPDGQRIDVPLTLAQMQENHGEFQLPGVPDRIIYWSPDAEKNLAYSQVDGLREAVKEKKERGITISIVDTPLGDSGSIEGVSVRNISPPNGEVSNSFPANTLIEQNTANVINTSNMGTVPRRAAARRL